MATPPSSNSPPRSEPPCCVLITGAARRIGADVARHLHASGMDVIIHYHRSGDAAAALVAVLNAHRGGPAQALQADLAAPGAGDALMARALQCRARVDVLINNASVFFPTPLPQCRAEDWASIMRVNLEAPLFLARRFAAQHPPPDSIINIADIHAVRPLAGHLAYCVSQAGLLMLTRSLAKELAPDTRVNSIAPGAISWPEGARDAAAEREILEKTALRRLGDGNDIAKAAHFLIRDAGYITGQSLAVDGGRTLHS